MTLGARIKVLLKLVSILAVCLMLIVGLRNSHMTGLVITAPTSDHQAPWSRYNVDCAAIYDMDLMEIWRALDLRKEVVEVKDYSLVNLTSNCDAFLEFRGYKHVCVSQDEENFPIAYSLVVHKDAVMVERVIKALYSPSNIICIHYDMKSSAEFRSAMEGLAQCLPNVFIATKRESVMYAGMSRLKADLHCMSDLLKSDVQWKYIINLCGQDFPLRTNIELVSELSRLKGGNMLETTRPSEHKKKRFTYHHKIKNVPVRTPKKKEPPPHDIEMFVGSAYFVLSREFVEFMQTSDVVKDFLAWSEDTYSPDEHFWGTLARLPGVPGEIPRSQPDVTDLMVKTRLVKWSAFEGDVYPPCTGTHVRGVCIYGLVELHWLLNYGHWFANKFDPKVDNIIIQCLEENLEKKRRLFHSLASPDCNLKRNK